MIIIYTFSWKLEVTLTENTTTHTMLDLQKPTIMFHLANSILLAATLKHYPCTVVLMAWLTGLLFWSWFYQP